jgi:hypothetical protein
VTKNCKCPFPLVDFIIKLKGGSFEWDGDPDEELIQSILEKTPQSFQEIISFNKFIKKISNLLDPLISSPKFWKMVQVSRNPVDADFPENSLKGWFKFSV